MQLIDIFHFALHIEDRIDELDGRVNGLTTAYGSEVVT
jgi:hypothetical protein